MFGLAAKTLIGTSRLLCAIQLLLHASDVEQQPRNWRPSVSGLIHHQRGIVLTRLRQFFASSVVFWQAGLTRHASISGQSKVRPSSKIVASTASILVFNRTHIGSPGR